MTMRTACGISIVAMTIAGGCGDTEPSGDQENGPTSSSTAVAYNDKDDDGKAPEDG